ncbi:tetratricopeptide repeat protein [Planctomicrobium sp. SH668]|uniref:tetratricopeptide repeat protein n=1 Tax=Planctomicrobium sp. SH668 TaxID=3448126 RepID=UPI003F5CAE9C
MTFQNGLCFVLIASLLSAMSARESCAGPLEDCQQHWMTGQYEKAIELAAENLDPNTLSYEQFVLLKSRSEVATGKYQEAYETLLEALTFRRVSPQLNFELAEVAPYVGKEEISPLHYRIARDVLQQNLSRRGAELSDLLLAAKAMLRANADPKSVQTVLLKSAEKIAPNSPEPFVATGELALEKRDYSLAAESFRKALTLQENHVAAMYGLARAVAGSDADLSTELIEKILKVNPQHSGALLMNVQNWINAEQYEQALETLDSILSVNAVHPEALAYSAAIHFLQNNDAQGDELRSLALSTWKSNPAVDHQIGRILSEKYRFEAGANRQRLSLALNNRYHPAMKQLAMDLLRLGQEEEGWERARLANSIDPYDVTSFNLVTLRDELRGFTILTSPGFQIRMEKKEAAIYGDQVVQLLHEAKAILCEKYQLELPETIFVEIFPNPSDFAVRTFGLPGAGSFLGVCFGDVITATSPVARAPLMVNWKSVLWHEFVHVVTLNKTHNLMPRWLSEGISVYEERQKDPRWGEQMTPSYRRMILGGELAPISELSGSFMQPKTPEHLMFAYFESSLVVEHIINTYGVEALIDILNDLAIGMHINEAIERHTAPMQQLEEEFEQFATNAAMQFGPNVIWETEDFSDLLNQDPETIPEAVMDWAAAHPRQYLGLKECAQILIKLEKYIQAATVLEMAVECFPTEPGTSSSLSLLAEMHRKLNNTPEERRRLREMIDLNDDPGLALIRLLTLDENGPDSAQLRSDAFRLLEINPLLPLPYSILARTAEQEDRPTEGISALKILLQLSPHDPGELHFRLAKLLQKQGDFAEARRHVLQALEIAPRYREAMQLLLSLQEEPDSPHAGGGTPEPVPNMLNAEQDTEPPAVED